MVMPMPDAPARLQYSVTSLMVYEACPLQYYDTFVKRIPPPRSRAMETGVSIHTLIARHLVQPPLLPPEVAPELQRLLEAFRTSRFNVAPIMIERAFVLPLERADVSGRIDVVLPRPGGGLEVVDFKSGTTRSQRDLDAHLQLPLYVLAVSRLFDRRPGELTYTYFFLRDRIEVSFRPTTESMQRIIKRVEGLVEGIQAERFQPPVGCSCYACRRERRRHHNR
jgi:DNA helicase-2/ATP-dependent DNA helicase PcrA